MDLSENSSQYRNYIKQANGTICRVAGKDYQKSIIITPDGELLPLSINSASQLTEQTFNQLSEMKPEVVIIGSGDEIKFPDTEILWPLVKNNIGLEVMTNQAAARTFNVLLEESRIVICVMIIG